MVPMTSAKRVAAQKNLLGTTAGVVIVLLAGLVGTGAINHVDQRIAQLEQAQKALAPQDGMNSMADVVQTHAKQLKSLAERQDSLTRQIGALTLTNELQEKLEQQLQAQQVELNALKDSIESVKSQRLKSRHRLWRHQRPYPQPHPRQPKSSQSTNLRRLNLPRVMRYAVARKAPFVLTGVEQRGTSTLRPWRRSGSVICRRCG